MTIRAVIAALMALGLCGCNTLGGLYGHDEFSNYTERKDTITMSAGDAARVNATTHTDNYWAPHTADRRIDTGGERAAKAVECYRIGQAKPTGGTTTTSESQTRRNPDGSATTQGTEQRSPTMSKGC